MMAQNKVIDNIFGKYAKKSGFSSVHIKDPAKTLPSANKRNSKELKEVLEGVKNLKILSYDKDKSHNTNEGDNFAKDLANLKPGDGFQEVVSVQETEGFVKMMIRKSGDKVTDLLMISSANTQLNLILISGDLDLAKLTNASKILSNLVK
jgi:hypothetical protein